MVARVVSGFSVKVFTFMGTLLFFFPPAICMYPKLVSGLSGTTPMVTRVPVDTAWPAMFLTVSQNTSSSMMIWSAGVTVITASGSRLRSSYVA